MTDQRYSFKLRPYYGLKGWLIEIWVGARETEIIDDFVAAIASLDPVVGETEEYWMVSELHTEISTRKGKVSLNTDIFGFAFVKTGNDKEFLDEIVELLKKNPGFEFFEINPNDYK